MRLTAVATDLVAATLGASGAYLTVVLVWPGLTGPTAFFVAMAFATAWTALRSFTGRMRPAVARLAQSEAGAITVGMLLLKLFLAVVLSGVVLGVLVPWLHSRGTEFSPIAPWAVLLVILAVLFLPDVRQGLRRRG